MEYEALRFTLEADPKKPLACLGHCRPSNCRKNPKRMRHAQIQTYRDGTKTTVPGRLASDNTLYEVMPSGAWKRHGPVRQTKKERIRARRKSNP